MRKLFYGLLFMVCIAAVGCAGENRAGDATENIGGRAASEAAVTAAQDAVSAGAVENSGEEPIFTSGEYQDGVRIDGCENMPEKLVIPEEIDGKPVIGIGQFAFAESEVREVIIPEGVRFIGDRAFRECESLERVEIRGVGLQVQTTAFLNCPRLKEVIKPEESKTIVFVGNSLTSYAYMPSHMQAILSQAGRKEYNVMSNIRLGLGLEGHLEDCGESGLDVALAMADIVVLQDAYIDEGNKKYIDQIYEKCSSDVKLYYVLTNWMEKDRREKTAKIFQGYHGIEILDTGNVFDEIVRKKIYTEKQLYVEEDDHPNCLAGYFYTLFIYHKIWKEDVTAFGNLDFLNPNIQSWFTTPSGEEEMAKVREVQQIINGM